MTATEFLKEICLRAGAEYKGILMNVKEVVNEVDGVSGAIDPDGTMWDAITDMMLNLVKQERRRQDKMYGCRKYPPKYWLAILVEEVGGVASEIQNMDANIASHSAYIAELIQVAVVAIAAATAELWGE